MKCKHCGRELIAITMYIEAGAFNVATAPAAAATWQPMGESYYANPAAAAAAPCVPNTINICAHEPATELPNTAGGNYQ